MICNQNCNQGRTCTCAYGYPGRSIKYGCAIERPLKSKILDIALAVVIGIGLAAILFFWLSK